MKKIVTTLVLLVACVGTAFAANPLRISQVYGGGGNTGATYSYDYVELYNNSGGPVDISGWSLQYGSATGTSDLGTCTNCLTVFPQGSVVPACGYWLVQLAGGTSTPGPLPVTADLVVPAATANNLSGTNGKIALVNSSTTGPCSNANIVDLVGWGTANCFETAATPALTNSSMDVRNGGGTVDTDKNSADFTVVANAVPRNSHSPVNAVCAPTPANPTSWGAMKSLYR